MGAVMDIVVWLRSLGLGRYEAAFRDNEIDETVLQSLTAEDLKDLGVVTAQAPEQPKTEAPVIRLGKLFPRLKIGASNCR